MTGSEEYRGAAFLPIVLGLLLAVSGPSVAQVLPVARNFSNAWQTAGYDGEIPTPDTIVNVSTFGVTGDGVSDDAAAIVAANCWVRGVESYNGFGGHVALVYSTTCEVTGCVMHHAHDYDGDGYKLLGSDHFTYGNNHETKGTQPAGTGDLTDYSYYLGSDPTQPPPTPSWWDIADTIPTIGPPHSLGPAKNIPASARYQAGGVLTVGPPSLYQQPTNIVVNQGQPAAFYVGAVGTPAASYQWYLAETELSGETSATLTMASAQPANVGTYHAIVSDPHGSVRAANATLTVNSKETFLTCR